jgi:hypothetical protein
MGGKGGGGGSNMASIQIQQQAANEARYKEMLREQRLREGTDAINALYDAQPVMGTRKVKGKIDPNAATMPAGYTKQSKRVVEGGADPDELITTLGDENRPVQMTRAQAGGPLGTVKTVDEILDPSGKAVAPGTEYEFDETYDTGQKKDKFQDLFDRYEAGQRDFYMPELQKQYGDARKKAYLAHAGAGTLWSSMRGDTEADIQSQNALNQGQIESQIQDSLGGLRRQIASDKSSLVNQLYATENPTMAANEALARTKTISQQTPPLSPMGDLFKIAAIGLGSAFGNANDPFSRVTNRGVGSTSSGFNRPA